MKKSIVLFLIILLFPTIHIGAQVKINGIYYKLKGQNATVTYSEANVLKRIPYTGNIILPNDIKYEGKTYTVTSIGDSAFWRCSDLISVSIPNSVTSIGKDSFYNCSKLTSAKIPDNLVSIDWGAFEGCEKLTSIIIPHSVTSIGKRAFAFCSGITSVIIPNSVSFLGEGTFAYCTGLKDIYAMHKMPLNIYVYDSQVGYVFRGVKTSACMLHIPKGSKERYAIVWNTFPVVIEDISL